MDLVGAVLRRRADRLARRDSRRRLDGVRFSIVADDCWGGEVYRLAGRPFNTPFVGLYVSPEDFLRILDDLPRALASDLVEHPTGDGYPGGQAAATDYPVGRLVDVGAHLHFIHYPSFDDARAKWMRRRGRVELDHVAVKMGFGPAHDVAGRPRRDALARRYAALPFATKLATCDEPLPGLHCTLAPFDPDSVKELRAGMPRFDHVAWLRGGSGHVSPPRRALRALQFGGWHRSP